MLTTPSYSGVSDRCAVPDAYLKFSVQLDRTRSQIIHRKPVRVVMFGADLDAVARGLTSPLEGALEKRVPGSNFEVSQDTSPGLAEDTFERLRTVVASNDPDLVIWQVGVQDAQALSNVDDFENILDQASAWVEAQGIDLVLVDPPFVPQVTHERIYIPYVGEIGETSRTEGVPVLRRYAAMQYWNTEREKRRGSPSDGAVAQPCVTELLAEAISRASVR